MKYRLPDPRTGRKTDLGMRDLLNQMDAKIRYLKKSRDWLARYLGVTPEAISSWMIGKVAPNPDNERKIREFIAERVEEIT